MMSCLVSTNAMAGSENRRSGSTARITAGLEGGRQHSSGRLFIRCDPARLGGVIALGPPARIHVLRRAVAY